MQHLVNIALFLKQQQFFYYYYFFVYDEQIKSGHCLVWIERRKYCNCYIFNCIYSVSLLVVLSVILVRNFLGSLFLFGSWAFCSTGQKLLRPIRDHNVVNNGNSICATVEDLKYLYKIRFILKFYLCLKYYIFKI